MPLPPYRPQEDLPDPVVAFEAGVPVGVSPFEVTSFKASLIREGSARLEGNFDPFTVVAHDLILMRPGARWSSLSIAPVDMAVMQVHPMFLVDQVRWTRPQDQRTRQSTYESLLKEVHQPVVVHLPEDAFLTVAELYAQLVFLSSRPSAFRRLIARATELIWEIEELLAATRHKPLRERLNAPLSSTSAARDEVQEVIRTMHEHYASNLTVRELAHGVSLSESALRRAFLESTGLTPREHLHRIRLLRFEELVAESTIPLAEAARMAGWTSPSHARSAFARSHGMSPSEFRAETQDARRADWWRTFGG